MPAKRNLGRLAGGRRRALAGATVLALAAALTACSGNTPAAPLPFAPPEMATPTPPFATPSATATATAT
ncbi:MAG: hypothetical protein IT304_02665, partial [Dehalococcoidia bacterium]|nr:hypothetical protein [Dehalococcoidia bacterium]